jgi:predicted type IV restriction endonuclease
MESCGFLGGYVDDYITGRQLPDSDNERIRQKLEKFLVEEKGFPVEAVTIDQPFEIECENDKETATADILLTVSNKPFMLIQCHRGSIVTRHREAISAARLALDTVIPITVVTNGEDLDILDSWTGQVRASGWESLPDLEEAETLAATEKFEPWPEHKLERESRVFMAFADFECSRFCK